MSILITGGAGFIGLATTRRAALVDRVRCLARHGSVPGAHETILVPDIAADVEWPPLLDGVTAIIHLAARVHVMADRSADPLADYRRVNRDVTRRLAEAAAAAGVRRFVYVSTVKVHGECTSSEPLRPDSPVRPVEPYARSKAEAEELLLDLQQRSEIEVAVVRPPLVYGPRVRANFLRLMWAIERGMVLPLGLVSNRRSMVFVDNLADLLVHCAVAPGAAGAVVLATDGAPVSTPQLLRALAEKMDRPARLFPVPLALLRAGAGLVGKRKAVDRLIGSLEVDPRPLQEGLGWTPAVPFEEGLRITAEWFQSLQSV